MAIEELGPIDAVLLSHDQHVDNLDPLGRVVLEDAPVVLTTMSGANRLGGASRGLVPWQRVTLKSRTESDVYVMAVPAQHGPDGTTHITGDVTGFVLSGAALPTVYISGDNASLALVAQISERVGKVDLAVIFAGGARSPKLLGDAYLTLTGRDAAQAALLLGATFVVPSTVQAGAIFPRASTPLPGRSRRPASRSASSWSSRERELFCDRLRSRSA